MQRQAVGGGDEQVGAGRGLGRRGGDFWVIAENGLRAGYVRNIAHDPRVRVRLRVGLRYRWFDGLAEIRPDDDPLARQRMVVAWHPLRAFNAMNVRVLGADLVVVHVRLLGVSGRPRPVQVVSAPGRFSAMAS